MTRQILFTLIITFGACSYASAQAWNPSLRCVVGPNGECIPNSILPAVPFLTIIPDAVGGAMGDAGVATDPNAFSMHYNASKLAFADREWGASGSYTPWLRNLGVNDVYLLYLSGYKKIDELQTVGAALRFFNLGIIQFTDISGNTILQGQPREFDFTLSYARKLSSKFSASVSGKFIYSNLASGITVGNTVISSGKAFAADIGINYRSNPDLGTRVGKLFSWGLSITNLGSKITYTNSAEREFIPANLRLGAAYKVNVDDFNSLQFALDLNKLLVPTPDPTDPTFSYRNQSSFGALFSSFGDAPGGFSEELQEFSFSVGAEYWYDQQFAVRAGYYYEHPLKGNRQYLTVGVGLKYNLIGIDIAYLAPTNSALSPLDNTLRFSFTFNGFGDEAR